MTFVLLHSYRRLSRPLHLPCTRHFGLPGLPRPPFRPLLHPSRHSRPLPHSSNAMEEKVVPLSFRGPTSGTFCPAPIALDTPQFEGDAPERHVPFMQGPLWGSLPSYAKFLQSFLHRSAPSSTDKPLLSLESWEQASRDDLAISSLEVPQDPMLTSLNKMFAEECHRWVKYKDEECKKGLGWSLLQAAVLRDEVSLDIPSSTRASTDLLSFSSLPLDSKRGPSLGRASPIRESRPRRSNRRLGAGICSPQILVCRHGAGSRRYHIESVPPLGRSRHARRSRCLREVDRRERSSQVVSS